MRSNQNSQAKPTLMILSIPEDDDFDNVGPMPSNNYGPLLTPTIPSRMGSSRLAGRRVCFTQYLLYLFMLLYFTVRLKGWEIK